MSLIPADYQATLLEIKQLVLQARHKALHKVNTELIKMYRNIGKMIFEKTSTNHRGSNVVDSLSQDLQNTFP